MFIALKYNDYVILNVWCLCWSLLHEQYNSTYKQLNTTNKIKYLAELAAGGELVGGLQPGHQVVQF